MISTKPPWWPLSKAFCLFVSLGFFLVSAAQHTYKPASVLANGTWFKISVAAEGVYKMDAAYLSSLGLGANIPSAQIRLFGREGGMLPEANAATRIDDLEELAIAVEDGGDGQLNGNDYVLFYSPGPHAWKKDSANGRFSHQKNLYSEKAFYFLSVGGTGKRIAAQSSVPPASATVTSYNERYFHELDTVNFLSSGKEWYGEELSALPGHTLNRSFTLPLSDILPAPATLVTSAAARSANTGSGFGASVNNVLVQQFSVPLVSTGAYDRYVQEVQKADNFVSDGANITLNYTYSPGSVNSQGWLNWFEFFCRRSLVLPAARQLFFRDWNSVGNASVQFRLTADASAQVWDVTNALQPVKMASSNNSGQLSFNNDALRLREYVAFSTSYLLPKGEGKVSNQNLHATTPANYFIVSPPSLLSQAQRLAQFHQQREGLLSVVATPEQIFNEFSAGIPDPAAIRDFIKMYFDKYTATWNQKPKCLLLFGKGSFDYKDRFANNINLVPVYESASSVDPLSTYTSDDFFGFLEDAEDINSTAVSNTLDIGIGRIPATNVDEAKAFVDKLMDYHAPSAFGPWRTALDFIADDEDQNLHLQDAEVLTNTVLATAPVFNPHKIYLDAFQQENGSSGGQYPQANVVVNSDIYNGTLLWNYSGHGGSQRLAEEVILDQSIVNNWRNQFRLPLFVTATCDFAPYDNPSSASLGENLLLRPKTGAIGLMTTSRVVFAFSNRILNNNYLQVALQPNAAGRYKSLGEAVQASKNLTYATSGDVTNNRKFSLLGDPAMTLAFPALKAQATTVNGKHLSAQTDTLGATEFVTIEGEVQDNNGAVQTGFNGTVYVSLFDKPKLITTLGNDAASIPVSYADQSNVLFKGKASATGGKFSVSFRLPKDIDFQFGAGKISLYAQDETKDAAGYSTNIIIGGIAQRTVADNLGPEIKAYLNDERFVNGSISNESPVLLLKLFDSSGINTGSSGIDHDIIATLDGNNNQYFVLNNFYETDVNSYQKGTVRFQLSTMAPGPHTLKIKAWDVMNNSSEYSLNFTVANNENLRLDHVLNYPNPFTTHTAFWFEHNYPGVDLFVKVDIFTISGKRIKTITQTINTQGNRSMEASWDGRGEWGEKLGRGIYLYHLWVKAPNGKTAGKWERMVLLQ